MTPEELIGALGGSLGVIVGGVGAVVGALYVLRSAKTRQERTFHLKVARVVLPLLAIVIVVLAWKGEEYAGYASLAIGLLVIPVARLLNHGLGPPEEGAQDDRGQR